MDNSIKLATEAIDNLGNKIIQSYGGDATFAETWGWNCLPLNRHDLSNLAFELAKKLRTIKHDITDEELVAKLHTIPTRINVFINQTLPYLYNGNAASAGPIYIALIDWLNTTVEPLFTWEILKDNKILPRPLINRLRNIESDLNELIPEKDKLKNQIKLIQDATLVAEDLPTTLTDLKEANKKFKQLEKESDILHKSIYEKESNSKLYLKDIEKHKGEAEKLIERCEEAFGLTTTVGLAASFENRARKLGWSITTWVVVLLIALCAGALIGHYRFEAVNEALTEKTSSGHVWILIFLSALSLGAPIWLAWLATKQIAQRFKLSEDYAFKASVAKAYQGYKVEAKQADPEMVNRLFASALTRFDELPLRLMEQEAHGSPWQELLNNPGIIKRIKEKPELLEKLLDYLFKMMTKDNKSQKNNTSEEAES
jgi:hypothetical protein